MHSLEKYAIVVNSTDLVFNTDTDYVKSSSSHSLCLSFLLSELGTIPAATSEGECGTCFNLCETEFCIGHMGSQKGAVSAVYLFCRLLVR